MAVGLPEAGTVGDAIEAARGGGRFGGPGLGAAGLGIWSRPGEPGTPLRDGDRVEIYRALQADPKAMRRSRARLKPSSRSRNGP